MCWITAAALLTVLLGLVFIYVIVADIRDRGFR